MGQGSIDAESSFLAIQSDRQDEYDEDRLTELEAGFHTMRTGKTIKLSKMTISHLQNSINYAKNHIESPYWSIAKLVFEEELKDRNVKVKLGDLV